MSNSFVSDIGYCIRLLRLNVMQKRFMLIWVLVVACSFPMVFVNEDLSYTALICLIMINVLEQIYLMLMVSDMFVSSPLEKEIIQRAQNRFVFLVYMLVYLALYVANYFVAALYSHEPHIGAFTGLAIVQAVYRIASVFLYRKRFVSYIVGGMIGGFGAVFVMSLGQGSLGGFILRFVTSYADDLEVGFAILVIGEVIHRILQRKMWRFPIDKKIFDGTLKRFKYGR